jgi:hypothetical protein
VAEWAAVVSTLVAGIGLLFAGGQLMVMNKKAAMARRVARDGVVVAWRPIEVPRGPEEDGTGAWLYEVEVHNPGQLPVDDIRVDWYFEFDVRRRRSGVVGPATRHLKLFTPVLPGGGMRRWQRRLVMSYAEADANLRFTRAELHFVDSEGRSQTNHWPRSRRPGVKPAQT